MYQFSYSVPTPVTGETEWQQAAVNAKLRRIEFSCPSGGTVENAIKNVPDAVKLVESGKLEVGSVHIPFGRDGWDLTYEDEKEYRQSAANISALIRGTAPLRPKFYTLHGDAERNNTDRPAAIKRLRDGINTLLPILQEQNACINVEMLPRTCIGNSAEELEAIVDGFPMENVGINLDVNHLNGKPEQIPAMIRRLGKRIRACHFSDYDGVDECHWIPPYGVLDWSAIMKELRVLPQKVLIIFECWGYLEIPSWEMKRPLSACRIRSFEKAAAILESFDRIQWDMKF